ncbi:MAG TPA: DivIVA domain-containing protein [Longimicrobiales bacterium]
MIDLTPLEVRKKKGDFRRGMRGYDPQSVDDFLDVVADRMEQLVREHAAMSERLSRVEDQVNDYRERERALTEALVTAQEMREEMRKQIEREVELKRREAEQDAETIRAEAVHSREREEESLRTLRARQTQFLQSYRSFLERELTELAVMAESLDMSRGSAQPAAPRRPRKRGDTEEAAPAPAPAPRAEPKREPEARPATESKRAEAAAAPESVPAPAPAAASRPGRAPEPPRLAESLREPELPLPAVVAPAPIEPVPTAPPAPPARPQQMPMPFAVHAPAMPPASEPLAAPKDFDINGPFVPDPEPYQPPPAAPLPREKTFDEMLNELPSFAGTADVKQVESTAAADAEAEHLAEVRDHFDTISAGDTLPIPAPEPMPEVEDVLELVDDVADDEDEDGWMSTLLEGRGDDGTK